MSKKKRKGERLRDPKPGKHFKCKTCGAEWRWQPIRGVEPANECCFK